MSAECDARIDAGRKVVREMLGEGFLAAMDAHVESGSFGADVGRMAFGSAFADAWARDGLTRRERSLVVMGVLISLRTPAELKNHVRAALNNGCTVREIEEVMIQTVPYVGFPSVSVALHAAIEVLKEQGLA
jgi:4-carboxymuconolactone decarboxylase